MERWNGVVSRSPISPARVSMCGLRRRAGRARKYYVPPRLDELCRQQLRARGLDFGLGVVAAVGIVILSSVVPSLRGLSWRSCNVAGARKNSPGRRLTSAQLTEPVRQQAMVNWPSGEISRGELRFHF